jgi:hypothetical protein
MATVLLGTNSPKSAPLGTSASVNGEQVPSQKGPNLPDHTVVLIETPDVDGAGNPVPLDKRLSEIRTAFALHSGEAAAWVEGSDVDFTKNVSQVFNCSVGRPSGWDTPQPVAEKPQEPAQAPAEPQSVLPVQEVQVVAQEAPQAVVQETPTPQVVEQDPSIGEGVTQ